MNEDGDIVGGWMLAQRGEEFKAVGSRQEQVQKIKSGRCSTILSMPWGPLLAKESAWEVRWRIIRSRYFWDWGLSSIISKLAMRSPGGVTNPKPYFLLRKQPS
jgi:hypothetical protein